MTTGPAPPTIPLVETGTPPREWSESVLASGPAKDTPAGYSEFRGRADDPDTTEEKSRDASRVTQGIKETVAPYLCKSLSCEVFMSTDSGLASEEGKEEQHVSLPSTELKGAQPSERTGGIGALPGNLSESSVALLPDERQERAQERRPTCPRQRRDTIKPSAAGEEEEVRC